jgi:hypothetical protein
MDPQTRQRRPSPRTAAVIRTPDAITVAAAPKDRWHQLADAIGDSNLPASDKAIFRYLLDKADWRTAELAERWTPTEREIRRKTSHSLRQVKYSIEHLARHGWITADRGEADKRRRTYTLTYGWACDCPGRRHAPPRKVQPEPEKGATPAPQIGATDRCNAAGSEPLLTERLREEGVREGSALCFRCGIALDRLWRSARYTTHPLCWPDEPGPLTVTSISGLAS